MNRDAAPSPACLSHQVTRRVALTGITATIGVSGAAYAQLSLGNLLGKLGKSGATPTPTPTPSEETIAAGRQSLAPRGYSEGFVPIRAMLRQGQFASAIGNYYLPPPPPEKGAAASAAPATPPKSLTGDPYLAHVEMGMIAFESGAPNHAIEHLRAAEESLAQKRKGGIGRALGNIGRSVAGVVVGRNDITPYTPLDHEAILQLNYLALAHLVQGERACYNVTRRCIDQQSLLKAKFDKHLEDSRTKLAQQTGPGGKVAEGDRQSVDALANEFKSYDAMAGRVPNAYVNPLGDYLAGLIQEIASKEQPALRDNSRIAYENAGKLCGRSAQMTAAATAMARPRVPAGERVIHIIVGEGFSPSRDVMTFGLNLNGQVLPIRVPMFTPVPSRVERIDVYGAGTQKLAVMDPIGDFEAIRLRDQQDRIPIIMLGVMTSGVMSYLAAQQAKKAGGIGNALNSIREANASPDTRSWLSLPRRFHVARIVAPANAKSIQLVSVGAAGKRLAATTVALLPGESQAVVYARAIDDRIQVQSARRLWVDGRLEEGAAT